MWTCLISPIPLTIQQQGDSPSYAPPMLPGHSYRPSILSTEWTNHLIFLWDPHPPRITTSSCLHPCYMAISCQFSQVHHKLGGHHFSPILPSSARASMPTLTVFLRLGLHFLDFSSGDFILLTLSHPLPNPHSDFVLIHSSSPSEILKAHSPILTILYLVFIFSFYSYPSLSFLPHNQASEEQSFYPSTPIYSTNHFTLVSHPSASQKLLCPVSEWWSLNSLWLFATP